MMWEPKHAGAAGPDELLERTWSGRDRSVRGRELRAELWVSAAFLLAVCALIAIEPPGEWPHPVAALAVLAYALAARIAFPIGTGYVVPTQLFLVPMFVIAPTQLVPVLVFAGLVAGSVGAAARSRSQLDRVVFCAGDAFHSLGPAVVLVALADGKLASAGVAVLVLALAAQFACDLASSSIHLVLVAGVRARVQLRVLLPVWSADGALAALGLLAAAAAQDRAWAVLAPLPFVGLLSVMAKDRTRRVEEAHTRLRALEQERVRLSAAVQRLGDAFASNLDLDALLEVVARGALEALGGEAARATLVEDGLPGRSLIVGHTPRSAPALYAAECAFLAPGLPRDRDQPVDVLIARVGGVGSLVALVSVSRERPFSDAERELLDLLCEQATVSARNAIGHTELLAGEARLRHEAAHDLLTGLANRPGFARRLDHVLGFTARRAAVMLIDLDGFKLVNDTLGHDAGDDLLIAFARRLSGGLRAGDMAARLGGDEFAVLMEDLVNVAQAQAAAERLAAELSAPILVRGREFSVRASVGLAPTALGLNCEQTLRRADLAMYAAKRAGGDRVTLFQSGMLASADARVALARELAGAAGRGELELLFQPLVDLADGTTGSLESLVRWRHPRRGTVTPEEFVALSGKTGTISEIGRFALDAACRAATRWPAATGVGVDVYAAQLRDPGFGDEVAECLSRHGLAPERLTIQVAESVLENPDPQTLETLHVLHRSGVALALVDFGSGLSSLHQLAGIPIDVLKLDRRLVDLIDHPTHARLVASIVALAHSLGMRVAVDGVESTRQVLQLADLGADLGQGNALGPTAIADAFTWPALTRARPEPMRTPAPRA